MTGGKKRESSGRCEQPPVHNAEMEIYRTLVIKVVSQINDPRFLRSMYLHAECLKRTLRIK